VDNDKIRIAVVGLGFGSEFPQIYADHPNVEYVGICDVDVKRLNDCGDLHRIERRHSNIEDVLGSDDYDTVHLCTPLHSHAQLTLAALRSGKHCACAVPMGTSLNELREIIDAERETGLRYMMMETQVYSHHYFYVQALHEAGEFGRIQFMRTHDYHDMEGFADWWRGLPPMHYATHAVSPLLAITQSEATSVRCLGSGVMSQEYTQIYGNPYPIETALFTIDAGYDLAMEATVSRFATSRDSMESFSIYGEAASFEWQMELELPVLFRMSKELKKNGHGRQITHERVTPPETSKLLPAEIRKYTRHEVIPDPANPHIPLLLGHAHHGSHPHMVHEFVRSIIENRPSRIDAPTAAQWTAPGICAHESAMGGGMIVKIPSYSPTE